MISQQLDAKEAKQFWGKIWGRKEYNRKAEWMNNMKKELQGLEESPEMIIHLESLRATLKIYRIRNLRTMMEYMDSSFKNSRLSMTD